MRIVLILILFFIGNIEARAEIFFDDFSGASVNTSVWTVATWAEHGGQTSADRCYVSDGNLVMEFVNDDGTYLSSAIQTKAQFLYGKWEARVKTPATAGVLTSFFTIDWDNEDVDPATNDGTYQEIDIEILSKYPTKMHRAVHETGETSFQTNPDDDLGVDLSADFHTIGYIISSTAITWQLDGETVGTYTYGVDGNIYIDATYMLKLNMWSAVTWIEGPPTSGVTCTYLIDWIRFTPEGEETTGAKSTAKYVNGGMAVGY